MAQGYIIIWAVLYHHCHGCELNRFSLDDTFPDRIYQHLTLQSTSYHHSYTFSSSASTSDCTPTPHTPEIYSFFFLNCIRNKPINHESENFQYFERTGGCYPVYYGAIGVRATTEMHYTQFLGIFIEKEHKNIYIFTHGFNFILQRSKGNLLNNGTHTEHRTPLLSH